MLEYLINLLEELKSERKELVRDSINLGAEAKIKDLIFVNANKYHDCKKKIMENSFFAILYVIMILGVLYLSALCSFEGAILFGGVSLIILFFERSCLVDIAAGVKGRDEAKKVLEHYGVSLDKYPEELILEKSYTDMSFRNNRGRLKEVGNIINEIEEMLASDDLLAEMQKHSDLMTDYLNKEFAEYQKEIEQAAISTINLEEVNKEYKLVKKD